MHALRKVNGLLVVGLLALHPDEIGVWSEGNSAHDGALGAALVAVETFTGPGTVPIKEDIGSEELLGYHTGLGVALALRFLEVFRDNVVLSGGLKGSNNSIVEQLDVRLCHPLILNLLKRVSVLSGGFGDSQNWRQRVKVGVGGTEDEGMIPDIHTGCDQGCRFGIRPSNGNKIGSCTCSAMGAYYWSGFTYP
jgi:hypothetical protein